MNLMGKCVCISEFNNLACLDEEEPMWQSHIWLVMYRYYVRVTYRELYCGLECISYFVFENPVWRGRSLHFGREKLN